MGFLKVLATAGSDRSDDELEVLLNRGYRYALALTHATEEAEDLVHDACVSIARSGGEWTKGYLLTTIRNRFIDKYRREKTLLFIPIEAGPELAADSGHEETEPDYLLTGALEEALGELRTDEREVLFLSVVEGYTAQEIADLSSRPRGTVLSLLHRTKSKLRDVLGGRAGARGKL